MVGFYINLCAFAKASLLCCAYLLLYKRIRVSYNIITIRNNGVVEVELSPNCHRSLSIYSYAVLTGSPLHTRTQIKSTH